jgi:hypothetical protein
LGPLYESIADMKEVKNFELEIGGENDVVVEEGLATFQDQEQQTKVISEAVPFPLVPNPYPDQTPKEILERWYQVDSLQLTKTTPAGFYVTHPFYKILVAGFTAGTTLRSALSSFRYFRWKSMEVRYQLNSVPQVYGWVAAMSLPSDMTVNADEQVWLSFSDTTYLDFSVQDDVLMVVPWRHPDQWCDWYDQYQIGTGNEVDRLCSVYLYNEANPVHVLQSTASGVVTIQIYARFVGVETAGHIGTFDDYQGQSKGFMNFAMRGVNPNTEFREKIVNDDDHKSYFGTESEGKPQNATAPDPEPDDPDLRNNPFGSLVASHSRYVAGSGTQLAPCRDQTVREIISMPTCIGIGTIAYSTSLITLYDFNALNYSRINYMSQYFRMWRGSRKITLVIFSTPFITARYNVIVAWGKTAPIGYLGDEIVQDVTVRGTTKVEIEIPFLNSCQWLPTFWQHQLVYFTANHPMPILYLRAIQAPLTVGDVNPALPYVLYEQASPDFEFRSLVNPNPNLDPEVMPYEGQMKISTFGGGSYGNPMPLPNDSDTETTIGEMCRRWSGRGPASFVEPYPLKWKYDSASYPNRGVLDWLAQLYGFWSGQIRLKLTLSEVATVACWHTRNNINATPFGAGNCSRPEDGMANIATDLTRILDVTCPFLYTHQFMPLRAYNTVDSNPQIYANDFNIGSFPRVYWDGYLHDEFGVDTSCEQVYIAGGSDFTYYFPIPPPSVIWWPSYNNFPELQRDAEVVSAVTRAMQQRKTTDETSSCTVTINSK